MHTVDAKLVHHIVLGISIPVQVWRIVPSRFSKKSASQAVVQHITTSFGGKELIGQKYAHYIYSMDDLCEKWGTCRMHIDYA